MFGLLVGSLFVVKLQWIFGKLNGKVMILIVRNKICEKVKMGL